MTATYEISLQDHYLLTDALETRLRSIDSLLHNWSSAKESAVTEDNVSVAAVIAEYQKERAEVEAMLYRINDGIRTISNTLLKQNSQPKP